MSLYYKLKNNFYTSEERKHLAFIPQFRLECRTRDAENTDSLAMRIADPLWMLGRQWQFGEFKGEDNGSPIGVKANYRKEKPTKYALLDQQQRAIDKVPLELRVEAMEVRPTDLKSKVRIGQKFESLIEAAFTETDANKYIESFRTLFPLTHSEEQLDEKSERYFHLMQGAVIDGGTIWTSIQNNSFPTNGISEFNTIITQLKSWYHTLFVSNHKASAWNAKQLIHQFSVHGEGIELNAPDYQSGHLDWYSFDTAAINVQIKKETQNSESFIPVNVSFAAMPEKRLFAFEDSKLDLSGMEVETSDLVRLMIIDFSLVSGTDWFMIPLEMEVGELCWINYVEVTDVFGVTTKISHDPYLSKDPLKTWDVFKIRNQLVDTFRPKEHFLYLAPTTTFSQESPPLEDVLFLRDEYANMAWGIEKTICNAKGNPQNGFDLHLELNGPFLQTEEELTENGADANPLARFRLASPVPTNWIPYLPFRINNNETDIELRQAVMMRNEKDEVPKDIVPISRLVKEDLSAIREEAIPRAGKRIQLTKQRIRWIDGKTYIWLGRKVKAGRGEGSSGLAFDQLH